MSAAIIISRLMRTNAVYRHVLCCALAVQLCSSILPWISSDAAGIAAEVESSLEPVRQNTQIHVFTAPDESTPILESVQMGEALSPVAETVGIGTTRWYLVRSQKGTVGWVKAGDSVEAKKLEAFFKSLPSEQAVFKPTDAAPPSAGSQSQRQIIIPVEFRGRKAIVQAIFNGRVTGELEIDTGAGATLISRRIASDLRLYSLIPRMVTGVTGSAMASMARIESIRVGDAEVRNVWVYVHDMPGARPYEGLLGMDFLRHFEMSLDTRQRLLILTPRDESNSSKR